MHEFSISFLNIRIFFSVVTVHFEILSQYPKFDSSNWNKEHFQWIRDKIFREKADGLNGFDTFFSQFSTEFLGFACTFLLFSYSMAYCNFFIDDV